MQLKIESTEKGLPLLIVNKTSSVFVAQFKDSLQKYNSEVFVTPHLPKNIDHFRSIFVVEDTQALKKLLQNEADEIIFITFTKPSNWLTDLIKKHKKILKLIVTADLELEEDQLERLLWFIYGSGGENSITLSPRRSRDTENRAPALPKISFPFRLKHLMLFFVFILIILHTAFIPFLLSASYYTYKMVQSTEAQNIEDTQLNLGKSTKSLRMATSLYRFARPTLLFFSLALMPNNIIELNTKAQDIATQVLSMQENGQHIVRLLTKTQKTSQEKEELILRFTTLSQKIETLESALLTVQSKLPTWDERANKWKEEIIQVTDVLERTKKLLQHHESFFAKDSEKKYLILFANNMELRPGGGFIGSFGILTIKDYTIEPIRVYDVYDADGQMTAHIEPPEAIKKYLNVDHWFLRDSAFSPDFPENYAQAKMFLDREINERNFDGSILITTTAVQYIMKAFGDIYLPDSNERINAENFYIKTQYYAEKDFFPGSIQKKSFLSTLMRTIFIEIENASMKDLLRGVKQSFDEKQMVVFFEDQSIQDIFDSYYWAGRRILPQCTADTANCVVDYLFPVEANVGGNKANFFVDRSMKLDMHLNNEGIFKHKLSIEFKNNAPAAVYPGGPYHNYFQLLLPKYALVTSVTRNGIQVDDVVESLGEVKTLAMPLFLQPQEQIRLEVSYNLDQSFEKGKGAYQLIVQKQIGTPNTDFALSLTLPSNIHITNQNFTPLVKGEEIVYNTQLSTDKVFFIELLKE